MAVSCRSLRETRCQAFSKHQFLPANFMSSDFTNSASEIIRTGNLQIPSEVTEGPGRILEQELTVGRNPHGRLPAGKHASQPAECSMIQLEVTHKRHGHCGKAYSRAYAYRSQYNDQRSFNFEDTSMINGKSCISAVRAKLKPRKLLVVHTLSS